MKIEFAEPQDWDGMVRVLDGLLGATVQVTYKPGWEPLYDDRPITEFDPQSCEIIDVFDDGLELSYDDGSFSVTVKFADIEAVTYL